MALEPLFFFPGNTMKGFYGLTSFRGCVLTWLTTLNLDRGKDWPFDIYYHDSPMDTYLKNFINAYRCVYWMKNYVNWRTWRTLYPPLVCLHDEILNLFAELVDIFVISRFFWKLISCPFLIQNFHSVHFRFKKSRVRNQLIITKLFIALNKIYKIFKNFRTCFKFSNLFSIL